MTERLVFFWDSVNGFSRVDDLSQALAIIDDEILKLQSDSLETKGFPLGINTAADLALLMKLKSGFLLMQSNVKQIRAEHIEIAALAEQKKIPQALADSVAMLETRINQATRQLFSEVKIIINELNKCRQHDAQQYAPSVEVATFSGELMSRAEHLCQLVSHFKL